jgi:ribosome assembly protein YihI (activator of Der GTPase)
MSPPQAQLAPERVPPYDEAALEAALDRFVDSLVARLQMRDRDFIDFVDQVCDRLDELMAEARAGLKPHRS